MATNLSNVILHSFNTHSDTMHVVGSMMSILSVSHFCIAYEQHPVTHFTPDICSIHIFSWHFYLKAGAAPGYVCLWGGGGKIFLLPKVEFAEKVSALAFGGGGGTPTHFFFPTSKSFHQKKNHNGVGVLSWP